MEDGTYNTRQVKQILAKLNAKGTDYFGKFLKLRELQTLTNSTVTDKGLYRVRNFFCSTKSPPKELLLPIN